MRSLPGAESLNQLDDAIFYLAAGGALAAAVYTVGAAAAMPELGVTGAELTAAGALVSWWMRRQPARAVPIGLALGLLAAAFWLLRVQPSLEPVRQDPGLILALHMTIPLVAVSFVLVRAELAAFSLVPGLSVMGLAAGQGDEYAARAGFNFFLPLALLAVGYAMLSTGAVAGVAHRLPEGSATAKGAQHWRVRHWPVLAGVIIVIMAVAEMIYLPLQSWAEAHRWQIIYAIATPGSSPSTFTEPMRQGMAFRIGQGPVQLPKTPVLTFTGESAPYWRGAVYDQYLGTSWSRSEVAAPKAELESFPLNGEMVGVGTRDSARPGETHVVTVNADLPLIFYAPGVVRSLAARGPLVIPGSAHVIVNGYDVVEVRSGLLHTGSQYEVTSVPLEAYPGRKPERGFAGDRYLKLPFGTEEVADLARTVAGKEPTGREKLAALSGYLQQTCRYSLEAPAVPVGEDAVDYFVRHQKVGYCDLFASALAVMARAVDVPTRLVTGYAFPEPAGEGGGKQFVLTEADAHAWVEAYLPEAGGWVTVDPTPAGAEREAPRPWWTEAASRVGVVWRTHPLVVVGYGVVLVGALAVLMLGLRRAMQRRRVRQTSLPAADLRGEMSRLYLRFCHLLRRRGYGRQAWQTPLEYLVSLETRWAPGEGAAAAPWARRLTDQFVRARYSEAPVSEETVQAARDCLIRVRGALAARRKTTAR